MVGFGFVLASWLAMYVSSLGPMGMILSTPVGLFVSPMAMSVGGAEVLPSLSTSPVSMATFMTGTSSSIDGGSSS